MADGKRRAGFIAQDFENVPLSLGQKNVGNINTEIETDGPEIDLKTLAYDRVGSPILWTVCKNKLARFEVLEAKSF